MYEFIDGDSDTNYSIKPPARPAHTWTKILKFFIAHWKSHAWNYHLWVQKWDFCYNSLNNFVLNVDFTLEEKYLLRSRYILKKGSVLFFLTHFYVSGVAPVCLRAYNLGIFSLLKPIY